jgi:hypothetical protein
VDDGEEEAGPQEGVHEGPELPKGRARKEKEDRREGASDRSQEGREDLGPQARQEEGCGTQGGPAKEGGGTRGRAGAVTTSTPEPMPTKAPSIYPSATRPRPTEPTTPSFFEEPVKPVSVTPTPSFGFMSPSMEPAEPEEE